MGKRDGKKAKFRKKRGLLGTIGLAIGGVVALGLLGLLVLYAAHRPTFDKIGVFFGTVQRGMVVSFWQDVALKVIDDSGLEEQERVDAHDTVNRLALNLREGNGTDEQQARADKAAHAFIDAFEAGDLKPEKVRPVLEEAEAAVQAIETGRSSKKKSSKKKS